MLLAAVYALGFHAWLPTRMPDPANDRAVADVLRAEAQAGDVVFLHPWWTERARAFVPAGLPVVGYLNDEGDPLEAHPRIWVLDQPGLPRAGNAAFERSFGPHREALGPARTLGPYRLTLYRNDLYRPTLFSATDALASGQVQVYVEQPTGERTLCPSDGRAYRCPVGRDLRVAAEWHELFYKPERCLWMHPPGGAAKLVVEFPSVPAGRVRLQAGIAWEYAWMHGPDLRPLAAVAEDLATGKGLARVDLTPGMEGFHSADGVLTSAAPVRVWTQADSERLRDACVGLRVLGPSSAEGP